MADVTHGGTPVTGDTPHDAADAGRPIKIGGKASGVAPTAVADGDRVDGWFGPEGQQLVGSFGGYDRKTSASLVAVNQAAVIDPEGLGDINFEITGTFVGTVVFEATQDDATWFAIGALLADGRAVNALTAPARGFLHGMAYSQVRIRCSAYTSGTIAVRLEATATAAWTRAGLPVASDWAMVTLTGTGNTSVVAAPGVGLKIVVLSMRAGNDHASTKVRLDVKDGTTTIYSMPLAGGGGGFVDQFQRGRALAANTALQAALGAAVSSVYLIVEYAIVPA